VDVVEELRAFGLSLPGAHRKSPWPEHDDLAVRDKTFAYLPAKGKPFSLSAKSGWVSFSPGPEQFPSLDQLKEWVEESYRAQAPRKLVKELDERQGR
jgi:predicted DNA-binding protein (MmcQ/YjbR family)